MLLATPRAPPRRGARLSKKGDDSLPTVYERVKEIVIDKLGVEGSDVSSESSFVDNLNADSLDLVELIMAFEEEFSTGDEPLEISDEDAGSIATIEDAVNSTGSRIPR